MPTSNAVIRLAEDEESIRACYPVLRQLRPDLQPDGFLEQVRRQQAEGYRLALIEEEGEVAAVAGFRVTESLSWGRFLYLDDLVTDASRRSRGHGARLLAWVKEHARREGCDELHLDSGVTRFGAHRFYLREGLDITCHHFRVDLRRTST